MEKRFLQKLTIGSMILLSFLIVLLIIPHLFTSRINSNCSSAVASLKLLANAESTWLQQDCDGNGINDYWTYDISCIHRTYRKDNVTKVAFIAIDLARADMFPASITGGINPFGAPQIESWTNVITAPKSGYLFMAMVVDENGVPYNQNPVGSNKILATNNSKFAFVTYPEEYGISGDGTYIINENGKIYECDMGSDINKIVLRWPKPEELKLKWKMLDY